MIRCIKCARSWAAEEVRHAECPHPRVAPKGYKPGVGDHTAERTPEHTQ